MNHQTIIIGAGPAGLIAGRYLKDALILEAKSEIGKPVRCAEGISINALKFQNIVPDHEWISATLKATDLITPGGKIIERRKNKVKGYVIDRTKFEQFLAKGCLCQIKLNTAVVDINYNGENWDVKTINGEKLKCKYLIGADGPTSIVARKVFNEKIKLCGTVEYLIKTEKEIPTERIEMYLGNQIARGGYAWIFPKSKHTANIGIIGNDNFNKKFKSFLKNTVENKYGKCEILENRSGAIPSGGPLKTLVKNNALVIGDAGGFTDPLFKGGINQAMLSAKIAAECILSNDISSYEKKVRSFPFCDPDLLTIKNILYSFDDKTLNEIGNFFENKDISNFKNPITLLKFFTNPKLARNSFKIIKFFSTWKKNSDWLW